jgi:hypothetical protein
LHGSVGYGVLAENGSNTEMKEVCDLNKEHET